MDHTELAQSYIHNNQDNRIDILVYNSSITYSYTCSSTHIYIYILHYHFRLIVLIVVYIDAKYIYR
jgi:hypothetical protein